MKMKRWLSMLLALVMVLSLTSCVGSDDPKDSSNSPNNETNPSNSGDDGESAKYGGVLDIAVVADPGSADPHFVANTSMYLFSTLVYENPLAQDEEGNVCPNVCDYELSEDGLTLKLWVREGVTFHDGSAVEIEDVIASLERVNAFGSKEIGNIMKLIAEQNVTDGVWTVTFSKYSPNTLYYLSVRQTIAAVLPKEVCEKYGTNPITEIADCIGTGPYKCTSYQSGIGYETVRYDDYVAVPEGHNGEAAPKKAYMDKINVWVNEDDDSRGMGAMNGDYDLIENMSNYQETLLGMGWTHSENVSSKTWYIGFNTNGNRPTADVNLRKAIACMCDIVGFAANAEVGDIVDPWIIPEGNQYYTDAFAKADYRGTGLEKAKEYLAASNYNGEEIVLPAAKNENLIIMLHAALTSELGVNATIDYAGDNTFIVDMNNAWDVVIAGSTNVAAYPSLVPKALRTTYWANEEKDELFAQLETTPVGSADSLEKWDRLLEIWVNDAPNMPLCTYGVPFLLAEGLNCTPGNFFMAAYNAYWDVPAEHMD